MIELRWKLEPPMPNKGREDRWTLQYRLLRVYPYIDIREWSDWIDVPYFSPE